MTEASRHSLTGVYPTQPSVCNDPGTAFLNRTAGRRYATPVWERWINSPEWLEHHCADPYCSLLHSPYGECGIRVPWRGEGYESRVFARRAARLESRRHERIEASADHHLWHPSGYPMRLLFKYGHGKKMRMPRSRRVFNTDPILKMPEGE